MAKKKIFISFNFDDDVNYRRLLSALSENTSSNVEFEDSTPEEIQSESIKTIKGVLTTKIRDADYTLVVIGSGANSYHPKREEIGERNWQWWEIEKAKEDGHKFIAVKIDSGNASPEPLLGQNAKWAMSYKTDAIAKAIEDA